MIFDSFPNLQRAKAFANAVKQRFRIEVQIFNNDEICRRCRPLKLSPAVKVAHATKAEITPDEIDALLKARGFTEFTSDSDRIECEVVVVADAIKEMAKEFGGVGYRNY